VFFWQQGVEKTDQVLLAGLFTKQLFEAEVGE
jgi:hypothetical protein